jgi:hypothetical protein
VKGTALKIPHENRKVSQTDIIYQSLSRTSSRRTKVGWQLLQCHRKIGVGLNGTCALSSPCAGKLDRIDLDSGAPIWSLNSSGNYYRLEPNLGRAWALPLLLFRVFRTCRFSKFDQRRRPILAEPLHSNFPLETK